MALFHLTPDTPTPDGQRSRQIRITMDKMNNLHRQWQTLLSEDQAKEKVVGFKYGDESKQSLKRRVYEQALEMDRSFPLHHLHHGLLQLL